MMRRNSELNRLCRKWSRRGEDGAGALLPILIVGIIMVVVAASVALAVSYSSTISTGQISKSNANNAVASLLNSFETDIYGSNLNAGTANPTASRTISGVGNYKLYYSTSATQPKSATDSGVTALAAGAALPSGVQWFVIVAKPLNFPAQTAVFSYTPKGTAQVPDSVVNWNGSISVVVNSVIQAAPGVLGPVSIVGRDSGVDGQKLIFASGSVTSADIWGSYMGNVSYTNLANSTIRGNITTKNGVIFGSATRLFGNLVTSANPATYGTPTVWEGAPTSTSTLPAAPGQQALRAVYPSGILLSTADCASTASLKAKLESITSDTTVNVSNCVTAGTSWATSIKPKANLVLRSTSTTAPLAISGLTVSGNKTMSMYSAYALSLDSVNYIEGAKGHFVSNGSGETLILNSKLVGVVGNYYTSGGALTINNTTLSYSPVTSYLCTTTAVTCSPISSTIPHLTRVS